LRERKSTTIFNFLPVAFTGIKLYENLTTNYTSTAE